MPRTRTRFHDLLIPAILFLCTTTANAASLFASVDGTGALLSGNGVSSVTYFGAGQYEVTFSSDVSQCSFVSTTVNTYSQAIQSYTAGGHLGPNGV